MITRGNTCMIASPHYKRKFGHIKLASTPSHSIKVPVPIRKVSDKCICVLGVLILPLSMIFLLDFGNVPIFFVSHL